MNIEEVVLVDENNNVLGTMPKTNVHQKQTPLHRAFSCFVFNKEKKLLLQQRSRKKKTWPLVWSNSCCGHPKLNESNVDAVKRRLKQELNLDVDYIESIIPYRYTFSKDGIMENEICPVFMGLTTKEPEINNEEVEATKWVDWLDFLQDLEKNPEKYSPWCLDQVKTLSKSQKLKELIGLNL